MNLKGSKGAEKHADYLYKKSLGKSTRQPKDDGKKEGAKAKGAK